MKKLLGTGLFLCILLSTYAQQPNLVEDFYLGNTPHTSYTSQFTLFNNHVYFSADDIANSGRELWRTDGTTQGTVQVLDLIPGSSGSRPDFLSAYNGLLYFAADGELGTNLWATDGTVQGTYRVNKVESLFDDLEPEEITGLNGKIIFAGDDPNLGYELWISDGTEAGTQVLKDINPGSGDSYPEDLTVADGKVFFIADDGTNGEELWVTDGTPGGTMLVKDINAGSNDGDIGEMTAVNGSLYFEANDGTHGYELWMSDGTPGGTNMVKDIYGFSSSASPRDITELDGVVYFSAANATNGRELWKTDGTEQGTVMVKDINPGASSAAVGEIINVSDQYLLFSATNGSSGREVWKSDGTANGTVLLLDLNSGSGDSNPNAFIEVGGRVLFNANNGGQAGIWALDLQTNNAELILEDAYVDGQEDVVFNAQLIFDHQTPEYGGEVWISDGTVAGTQLLKNIASDKSHGFPQALLDVNGELYFGAFDSTDGKRGGARRLTGGSSELFLTIAPTSAVNSVNVEMAALDNQVVLSAYHNPAISNELFISDGTAAGTGILDSAVSSPSNFINGGDRLFFKDITGYLWKTDGTPGGTDTILSNYQFVYSYKWALDHLFFLGTKGAVDGGLWKMDPLSGQVSLVKDINPTGPDNIGFYREWKGEFYFTATEQGNDFKLFKTDGTEQGTIALADLNIGAIEFIEVNDELYFVGNDFSLGMELWKTDGTPAGTQLVKDIRPGSEGSMIRYLEEVNGLLVFSNYTHANGRELWVSDGTEAGTKLLKDIFPGSLSGVPIFPNQFLKHGDHVFFIANDGNSGAEVWMTDGTEAGTTLAADINPGMMSSSPMELTTVGDQLYCSAFHPDYGRELWAVDQIVGMDDFPNYYFELDLYPNPASDYLTVLTDGDNGDLQVMDLQGRLLKTITVSHKETRIDVAGLAPGIYFLKSESGISRFIKM